MAQVLSQAVRRDGTSAAAACWPTWLVVMAVAAAYAMGSVLAFVALGATVIVVLFLPAGVTLSALVLTPMRQWPWVLAAVAVTEIAADVWHGQSLGFVWGFAVANIAEPLVGAWLLRRRVPAGVDLVRRRDLVAFLGCAVLAGPLVGGLIGATTISVGLDRGWWASFLPFWAGDATGVLTVGGCVLAWRHRPAWNAAVVGRWVAALIATIVITAVGFWPAHLPLFYLPIPMLFWLAFSQRLPVALTCGLAMTVTANVLTSAGHGPWAALQGPVAVKTATLQLFLGVAILGAWFLAVGVAERDTARRATSAERAARQRLHVVQELTARLATAATSQAIAEAVVRDGAGLFADHAALAVVTPGRPEMAVWTATGRPPQIAGPDTSDGLAFSSLLAEVSRTGTRLSFPRMDKLNPRFPQAESGYRAAGVSSALCLPVSDHRGSLLGALALAFAGEDAVDADIVSMAETVASITGQALLRAQRYERERDAAHELQHALLPVLAGDRTGIRIGAGYRPADRNHEVGGDWYDVFDLPGGRIGLAVGDVVGHDLTAAAAMARIQSALRVLAQSADGPAQALTEVDNASMLIPEAFMTTIGYAEYDPRTGVLRYACAGHPPPLLLADGDARYLWGGRSAPVGVAGVPRSQAECAVSAGSTLIMYSDGLVERNKMPLPVSLEHLADVSAPLSGNDPDDLARILLQRSSGGAVLRDDAVVLCIRFVAESVRAAPVPVSDQQAHAGRTVITEL